MIARVRTVTEVHFDYDVGEPDEEGNVPFSQEAAEHAETEVLDRVKGSLPGTVLDDLCLIEELRQE